MASSQSFESGPGIHRQGLRLSAVLLGVGFILYVVMGLLHTGGRANRHAEVFAEYARSANWTAVHLGQFAGMAVIVAGLLALFFVLDVQGERAVFVARLGAVSAAVALGLYGVLQAVDGVALKQAVDAWMSAPQGEKAARFANAESLRWLEWGIRSFQGYVLGIALILLGSAVALSRKLPKLIGYLMGLSGLSYIVQGWTLASEGFTSTNTFAILASYVLFLAWITWLAVVAWRTESAVTPTSMS